MKFPPMTPRRDTFTIDVGLPVEQVWSVVSDTQKMNELVYGLEASTVLARDAEKASIRGTFGVFAPEYDEYPWVFEVPRRYRSTRVFSRGVLRRFEFECVLAVHDEGTRITFDSAVTAIDGIAGRIAAIVVARRLAAGIARLTRLLHAAADVGSSDVGSSGHASSGAASPAGAPPAFVWPPANPHREAVLARARPIADRIRGALGDDDSRVLDRLVAHVADATAADAARMRPYVLADAWGIPRRAVLACSLRAAHAGLLRLSWDLLCPSCEAPTSVDKLRDLPAGGHCPACDIDFRADFDKNVEATFRPEPAVRAAERLVFCHGSPASTPSWLAQFVVPPRASHRLAIRLGMGRYRLQTPGLASQIFLDVHDGVGDGPRPRELTATLSAVDARPRLEATTTQLAAGDCSIVVQNDDDKPRRVQMAWRAFASQAATAADVMGVGLFQELFGSDVLSPTQHVDVGQRTILFTDLVGSTAMYERIGDAAAYGMVRRHFELLGEAIEANNGHVVKTVGDAVMAAFDVPVDGARAGLACIEALRALKNPDGSAPGLKLRVGVHSGACLAVDANDHVDYFGRTVNIAARVESLGGPDELVLSWTVRAADDVPAFIDAVRANGNEIVDEAQRVKGIAEPVAVTRVRVRSADP